MTAQSTCTVRWPSGYGASFRFSECTTCTAGIYLWVKPRGFESHSCHCFCFFGAFQCGFDRKVSDNVVGLALKLVRRDGVLVKVIGEVIRCHFMPVEPGYSWSAPRTARTALGGIILFGPINSPQREIGMHSKCHFGAERKNKAIKSLPSRWMVTCLLGHRESPVEAERAKESPVFAPRHRHKQASITTNAGCPVQIYSRGQRVAGLVPFACAPTNHTTACVQGVAFPDSSRFEPSRARR